MVDIPENTLEFLDRLFNGVVFIKKILEHTKANLQQNGDIDVCGYSVDEIDDNKECEIKSSISRYLEDTAKFVELDTIDATWKHNSIKKKSVVKRARITKESRDLILELRFVNPELTQKELAEMSGVSTASISRILKAGVQAKSHKLNSMMDTEWKKRPIVPLEGQTTFLERD